MGIRATGVPTINNNELYSYLVYRNTSGEYFAKNGTNALIDYTNTSGNITTVLDSLADNAPVSGSIIVDIGPGNFEMNTLFNNIDTSNVTLRGQGMGVTNLIANASISGTAVIDIGGGVSGTSVSLVSGASAGDSFVTVASGATSPFVVGNYVLLRSNAAFNNESSSQGKKGEIRKVAGVSHSTIALDKWAHDSYALADSASIIVLNMLKNITLEDFTLKAGSGQTVAGTFSIFSYIDNLTMNNIEIQNSPGGFAAGINLRSCINSKIDVVCNQTPDNTFNDQYGVAVTCASENTAVRVRGKGRLRHTFTIDATGTANFEGQVRGITVHDSESEVTDEAHFDTHATGEGIKFVNCTVHGGRNNGANGDAKGFQMRARACQIIGCNVHEAIGKGITLMEDASNSEVAGCNIIRTRGTDTDSLGYGIEIRDGVSGVSIGNTNIIGSRRDGILIRGTNSSVSVNGGMISNNGDNGIAATLTTHVTVNGAVIRGNTNKGIEVVSGSHWNVKGCDLTNNGSASTFSGIAGTFDLSGNLFA